MRKRDKKIEIVANVEILEIVAEGKALAKLNDIVIFATHVVPGDVVDLQIIKKKKNYKEGIPVQFHKLSEYRTNPVCEHFGTCGGCKWLNVEYQHQLRYKQKQVVDALERIAKIEIKNISDILPSEKIYGYRNKLEYTFSNHRWFEKVDEQTQNTSPLALGFHVPEKFDRVVEIRKCWLQEEPTNRIRNSVRKFAVENNYEYYDHKQKKGFLRNLIIRNSIESELMVIIIFNYEDLEKRTALMDYIATNYQEITSFYYIINTKYNDSYFDQNPILYKGKDHIIDRIGDLKYKIGVKSFFQTNTEQAHNLYKITEEFAALTGKEIVYDLYTGAGTIANFLAKGASKVIGIEYIPEAIDDAKINSNLNNITNTFFFCGDVKNIFTTEFIEANGSPDVLIMDPPRAGIEPSILDKILQLNVNKIVYVSCNPATQARDINILSAAYQVMRIQPVDMFPHTQHVENVVLLERILT